MSEILRERYSVEHELGRGRFAIVSAVRDLQTGASLVLKRIPLGKALERIQGLDALGGSASEKILELFRREARVLGGLSHPGIPRHVDSFVVEKPGDMELCLVQERVDGKSLRDHLVAGRRFSETEVLAFARSAAGILSYLHELDPPVVHRDIKPGNVILREDGSIALIDFGAVMDAIAPEWGGSTIIGTVGYMPLEQYEGRATPASDVYSLGATLVHLLSRKEPQEIDRVRLRLHFRPHVAIAEPLAILLDAMLDPDPALRPANGTAILRRLEALTTVARSASPPPDPETPRSPSAPTPAPVIPPRNPASELFLLIRVAAALSGMVIAAGTIALAVTWNDVPELGAKLIGMIIFSAVVASLPQSVWQSDVRRARVGITSGQLCPACVRGRMRESSGGLRCSDCGVLAPFDVHSTDTAANAGRVAAAQASLGHSWIKPRR